jgi:heme exporter protein D
MSGFLHWFAMNGYSMYIWPAYGLVFFVLLMNGLLIKRQKRRTHKILRQWFEQS